MYNDITKKKQLRYKNEMKANDIINYIIYINIIYNYI